MKAEILALQTLVPNEDVSDEVEGERFSSISLGGCDDWSVMSFADCS